MSEPTPHKPAGPITQCPHCKRAFAITAQVVGKSTLCRGCKKSFVIALADPAHLADALAPAAAPARPLPPGQDLDSGLLLESLTREPLSAHDEQAMPSPGQLRPARGRTHLVDVGSLLLQVVTGGARSVGPILLRAGIIAVVLITCGVVLYKFVLPVLSERAAVRGQVSANFTQAERHVMQQLNSYLANTGIRRGFDVPQIKGVSFEGDPFPVKVPASRRFNASIEDGVGWSMGKVTGNYDFEHKDFTAEVTMERFRATYSSTAPPQRQE